MFARKPDRLGGRLALGKSMGGKLFPCDDRMWECWAKEPKVGCGGCIRVGQYEAVSVRSGTLIGRIFLDNDITDAMTFNCMSLAISISLKYLIMVRLQTGKSALLKCKRCELSHDRGGCWELPFARA